MRPVSKATARVLDTLTAGLEVGEARRFDAAPDTYMAVSVDRIGDDLFAVAHRFEQNGDLVPDPDMEFMRVADEWYPVACQMAIGTYHRAVELGPDGEITGWRPRAYADLRSFATMWMRNIREQQELRKTDAWRRAA